MTCIAGVVENGVVWIGSDSCGTTQVLNIVRKDSKVFYVGEFLVGYTSSFRMGQLLQYSWTPPKQRAEESDYGFMTTRFIDSVRECFRSGGYMRVQSEEESGGQFLVGYHGNLYEIGGDFQVGIPNCGYVSVGSGGSVALGSLHTTKDFDLPARERIIKALEAAEFWTPYVKAPFNVLCLGEEKKNDSERYQTSNCSS